jgi:lipid-binding SYLF domain-containing protein
MTTTIYRAINRRGVLAALGAGAALAAVPAFANEADDLREAQKLVDDCKYTAENFGGAPELRWVRENIGRAKGIMIVPSLGKGGFIIGGSGGDGVLLARDPKTGSWSYPAFYTLGSVSIGLQAGGEVAEVILLVMTQKGIDSLMTTDVKLGGDLSIAAGPVGAGAKAATADVLSFNRSKGLYGGLTAEGAIVATNGGRNKAYYHQSVSTMDILVRHSVSNSGADLLRKAVANLGH